MQLIDILIPLILLLLVGGAVASMIKAKKNGNACIGCPHAGSCGKHGKSCTCDTDAEASSEKGSRPSCRQAQDDTEKTEE